ncbi:dehydrogenase [Dendryphion nanum]|uniref:Dehydrogenase n=1 Tax=Dendryphion nanum TaxID=256645 RepID=A0A9P9IBQ2_9PLEO|nr:dehydrogenase [Dendryphion nanum]
MIDLSLGFCYRQAFVPILPVSRDIELTGKTAIITGVTSGIGFEATKILIQHKISRVILGVRDISQAAKIKDELSSLNGKCEMDLWELDYNSFESVVSFSKRAASLNRLDIVLLNAGVKPLEFRLSDSGHETTLQVNHLSTALLSALLLPALKATSHSIGCPSRLTIVSSETHYWVPFSERNSSNILARMDAPETFEVPWRYNLSKLLEVFWARELASRTKSKEVIVNTVNPGLCWSQLHREDSTTALWVFRKLFARPAVQGAHALVHAVVVQDQDTHGGYLSEQTLWR